MGDHAGPDRATLAPLEQAVRDAATLPGRIAAARALRRAQHPRRQWPALEAVTDWMAAHPRLLAAAGLVLVAAAALVVGLELLWWPALTVFLLAAGGAAGLLIGDADRDDDWLGLIPAQRQPSDVEREAA